MGEWHDWLEIDTSKHGNVGDAQESARRQACRVAVCHFECVAHGPR